MTTIAPGQPGNIAHNGHQVNAEVPAAPDKQVRASSSPIQDRSGWPHCRCRSPP